MLEDDTIEIHLGFTHSKARLFDAIEGMDGVLNNGRVKRKQRPQEPRNMQRTLDQKATAIPITGSLEGVDVKKVFEEDLLTLKSTQKRKWMR